MTIRTGRHGGAGPERGARAARGAGTAGAVSAAGTGTADGGGVESTAVGRRGAGLPAPGPDRPLPPNPARGAGDADDVGSGVDRVHGERVPRAARPAGVESRSSSPDPACGADDVGSVVSTVHGGVPRAARCSGVEPPSLPKPARPPGRGSPAAGGSATDGRTSGPPGRGPAPPSTPCRNRPTAPTRRPELRSPHPAHASRRTLPHPPRSCPARLFDAVHGGRWTPRSRGGFYCQSGRIRSSTEATVNSGESPSRPVGRDTRRGRSA